MADPQVPSVSDPGFTLVSERMGPLPLVNSFIERMDLPALMERFVPTTDRRSALTQ